MTSFTVKTVVLPCIMTLSPGSKPDLSMLEFGPLLEEMP